MIIKKNDMIASLFRKNISFMFFVYWAILVFWQNISGTQARSSADIVIKIGLLLYFVWFYLQRTITINVKIFLAVVLFSSLLILISLSEDQFSLSNVIDYVYPIAFVSMVYGIGNGFEVNKKHLTSFCNCVIVVTLYAAVYAILFCKEQFFGALSISSAYGNELSSFFISNFEYGMYLVCAIISCTICLNFCPPGARKRKILYILAMAVFIPNLILTFSRTSIFAMVFFFILYTIFEKGKIKRWMFFGVSVLVVVILLSPELSDFFFNIVLKGNKLGSRKQLFDYAIDYFRNGTIVEKLFGHGINAARHFFFIELGHGSIHNAYLQVLIYYGIAGLGSLIIFLLTQLIACIKEVMKDRFIGAVSLGILVTAIIMMFTTTAIVFTSSIDSYFLTIFMIVIPKYVRNSLYNGTFYNN